MKKRTLGAIGASIALAAGAVFVAVPATAADFYHPDIELGAEGESYPAGWFVGDPAPETAPTQDNSGLILTGRMQLLFGEVVPIADGEAFAGMVADAAVDAVGETTFQIAVFFDGAENSKFTTLRPAASGTPAADGLWISSYDVYIGDMLVLERNVAVSLDVVLDAFDTAAEYEYTPELLAFGVYVAPDATATVRSITFAGDTHYFTAEPVTEEPAPAKPIEKDATYTG